MEHIIQSDQLRVSINSQGAELYSIFSKETETEYLWQGDAAFWGSRAPILFPIVGGLKNGSYRYNGKQYSLPKHGFVRQAPFTTAGADGGSIVFEYTANAETEPVYPFAFRLRIAFTVTGNTLSVNNQVINETDGNLLFSIGSHEAYCCPRNEGEAFNDYYLEFEQDGLYESYAISPNGLLTDEKFTVINGGRMLPLEHSLFENDALIFKTIECKKVVLKSKKSPAVIEVDYGTAPHLGIWTKVGAPYICIEPWYGLPDGETSDGLFEHKEAINTLAVGETFNWQHTITICEACK